jgi:sugar lactone lactonase YvrE
MKKHLPFACFMLLITFNTIQSQTCSVKITGASCINDTLVANATGGTLAVLEWKQYTTTYYRADTVSSPNNIIVAGGNGAGSAANQFNFPGGGIAVDIYGNVYVADYGNNRVQKWAPGAAQGVTVAGGNGNGSAANQLSHPMDVAVDKNGNIYVTDNGNARVQKWAPGADTGITVAGGHGPGSGAKQLNGPRGIYVDNAGRIYIADVYNYRIQRWAPNATTGVTVAGGNGIGTAANQFFYPIDVYLDRAGNIYVADAFSDDPTLHRVQKWAPGATSGVTVAGGNGVGTQANQIGYLLGITVDSAGTVYIADNGVDGAPVGRIQKWLPGATSGVTVAGGPNNGWAAITYPTGVFVNKAGEIYVLHNPYNPEVQKFIPTHGIVNRKFAPVYPGPYTVTATFKNGCVAQSPEKLVLAPPGNLALQAAQPGGRANLCDGKRDTFLVYRQDDVTQYTWKVPRRVTVAANRNDSIIVDVPAGYNSGYLTVYGTNVCGTSITDSVLLIGRPMEPGLIYGPNPVLSHQTGVTYTTEDRGSIYNWTVPADAVIISGQGTANITVNWGATAGNIYVSASNNCGTSFASRVRFIRLSSSFTAGNQSYAVAKAGIRYNSSYIYPNPAITTASILLYADKQSKYFIQVQDVAGKTVFTKAAVVVAGVNNISLNVSMYAKGVYFVTVTGASNQKTSFKLIKQ